MTEKKITKTVESKYPYYIVMGIWVFGSFFFKMFKLSSILILSVISIIVFYLSKKKFDTVKEEIVKVFEDEEIQSLINQGLEYATTLKTYPETEKLSSLILEINKEIENNEKNKKYLGKLYKFYIPETIALMQKDMEKVKSDNVIPMLEKACTSILENIQGQKEMELNADIRTLEDLLKMDGLLEVNNEKN